MAPTSCPPSLGDLPPAQHHFGKKSLRASAKIYFQEYPQLLKYRPEHLIWETTFASPVELGAQAVPPAAPRQYWDGPGHVLPA